MSRHGRYPESVLPVLAVFHVLISFALLGLVLMHSGRDTGLGGMGYTPASQGGTHIVERNLTRLTVVVGVIFFINTIALYHLLQ
jgi:preprotein translocase subunit SecG